MANHGDFQVGIYLDGMMNGTTPELTTNLARLEDRAREVLSPEAMGYIVPSAGDGATTRANREAFDRWRLVPRMLRGAVERDLSTTVLGTEMAAPVMIAPIGVQTLAHPEGELATARAAAELGLTYIHSTAASHDFEQVAEASGDGSRWYQLYYPSAPASWSGRRTAATRRSSSRSTPRCSAGDRPTWIAGSCRSWPTSGSRTTCRTRRSWPTWSDRSTRTRAPRRSCGRGCSRTRG